MLSIKKVLSDSLSWGNKKNIQITSKKVEVDYGFFYVLLFSKHSKERKNIDLIWIEALSSDMRKIRQWQTNIKTDLNFCSFWSSLVKSYVLSLE